MYNNNIQNQKHFERPLYSNGYTIFKIVIQFFQTVNMSIEHRQDTQLYTMIRIHNKAYENKFDVFYWHVV